jgi:hypothetical protein
MDGTLRDAALRESSWRTNVIRWGAGLVAVAVAFASAGRTHAGDDGRPRAIPPRAQTPALARPAGLVVSLPTDALVPLPEGSTLTDPGGATVSLAPAGIAVSFPAGSQTTVAFPGRPPLPVPTGTVVTWAPNQPRTTIAFPGGMTVSFPASSPPTAALPPPGGGPQVEFPSPETTATLPYGTVVAFPSGSDVSFPGVVPPAGAAAAPPVQVGLANDAGETVDFPAGDLAQGLVPTFRIDAGGGGYSVSFPVPGAVERASKGVSAGPAARALPATVTLSKGPILRVRTRGRMSVARGPAPRTMRLSGGEASALDFPRGALDAPTGAGARFLEWLASKAPHWVRRS